ncbi:uncharacterized protein ACN427_003933 [Glossina fuscipes fuscipes]
MSSPSNVVQLRTQKLFELRQKYKEYETSMTNSSFPQTFSEDKHIIRPQEAGRYDTGSDILSRVIRSLKQVPFTGEFVIEPRKCPNKPTRNSEYDESPQFTGIGEPGKTALGLTLTYESELIQTRAICWPYNF